MEIVSTNKIYSDLFHEDQFAISPTDVDRLLEMRRKFYRNENERKLCKLEVERPNCSTEKSVRRRDMEWLSIILPFVKIYNPHCGVCASSKNYGRRLDRNNSYLLRSYFYCQAQDCPFSCAVTIKENGKGLLSSRFSNGNFVDHRNAKRVARPNRSSMKFDEVREKKIFRSRKSFNGESTKNQIDSNREETNEFCFSSSSNLFRVESKLRQEIEPNGFLPGGVQQISLCPFFVTIHTESSLKFYQTILTKKSTKIIQIQPATNNQSSNRKSFFFRRIFFIQFLFSIL